MKKGEEVKEGEKEEEVKVRITYVSPNQSRS